MTILTITDLSITADLDRKAMATVRGGYYRGGASYGLPSFSSSKHDFEFSATQLASQTQNNINETGNNVAFASDIHSTFKPTQTNSNNISF